MTNFLELAKDRYSVRKFTDKQIEQEKLDMLRFRRSWIKRYKKAEILMQREVRLP